MEVMDDDARLIPEQGLPEAPSTIPLSWDFPQDAAERLEAACVAAEECAEACAAALQETDEEARRTLAAISGVAGFVAECGRGASSDSRMALSLCVRVIESNSGLLDSLGRTTGGAIAASSSRRCATECSRSLAASYLELEG
jgi:hypothetical protein